MYIYCLSTGVACGWILPRQRVWGCSLP